MLHRSSRFFVCLAILAAGSCGDTAVVSGPSDAPEDSAGDVTDDTGQGGDTAPEDTNPVPDDGSPADTTPPPDTKTDPLCSAPLEVNAIAYGPLPEPAQPRRGVDALEWASYTQLRDEALSDPGVHFVATYDTQNERFLVESGPTSARKTLAFRRVAKIENKIWGVEYEVLQGQISDIFPSIESKAFGPYEEVLAAFVNPNGVQLTELGYTGNDPRVGYLPPQSYPYPMALVRIAALFDAPDAPDVVASLYPWAHPAPGTHGTMGIFQSRSTLVLSGKGAKSGVVLDNIAMLPDVAPTVLAALGAPDTGGTGADGLYSEGLYLMRQDGNVRWEALAEDPCDRAKHVIVIVFDGLMATELNHLMLAENPPVELPTFRALGQHGAVYRYGAVTNYPSVSAPGHMTTGCGLWSGHHGILGNAFFRRKTQETINPFALLDDPLATISNPDMVVEFYNKAVAAGVETLAQAAHRALGDYNPETGTGAYVAVLNEIAIGGADYTTVDYLKAMQGASKPSASDLGKYTVADTLAQTQVVELLADESKPVPTILHVSFLVTDKAGEMAGPHSDFVRETLVTLDGRVKTVLDAYAARGALDDTLVVLTADHGMSLQDPSRKATLNNGIAAITVKKIQPMAGVYYLRTIALESTYDPAAKTLLVVAKNHDNEVPLSGVTVTCGDCSEGSLVSGEDGGVLFSVGSAKPETQITATHPEFNPQTMTVTLTN
jgi:hypothetical protein